MSHLTWYKGVETHLSFYEDTSIQNALNLACGKQFLCVSIYEQIIAEGDIGV